MFWSPSTLKSYVDILQSISECSSIIYKNGVHSLIKNTSLLKKPELSVSDNLFAGGESCLEVMAADLSGWQLLKDEVALAVS